MKKFLLFSFAVILTIVFIFWFDKQEQDNSLKQNTVKELTTPNIKQDNNKFTQYWVTSSRLNRRTCPSLSCGNVGQYYFRESARVYEQKGDWVRVSPYYNALCTGGNNEYVDSDTKSCTANNGVKNGKFAEWAKIQDLSQTRPEDPAKNALPSEKIISGSDDYQLYKTAFLKAAQKLIKSGSCTEQDFIKNGGWIKSVNKKYEPIYFTYCNGYTKYYLNAKTGEIN